MSDRFRWMAGLAVVLASIAVGAVAYNMGLSHGLAVSSGAAQGAGAYYRFRPWGFGFFPFGMLLFWFLIARLFLGGCGRRRWQRFGPYDGPSAFDDWHRRAHERMNNQPSE
jgi:hypothetical protein